jgi:hypothetical protein
LLENYTDQNSKIQTLTQKRKLKGVQKLNGLEPEAGVDQPEQSAEASPTSTVGSQPKAGRLPAVGKGRPAAKRGAARHAIPPPLHQLKKKDTDMLKREYADRQWTDRSGTSAADSSISNPNIIIGDKSRN